MEDEEFEKVFKKIEDVFHFGVYFDDCKDPDGSYTWDETERKQKLKEILEEMIAKEIDKAIREFYFKEAKP